MRVIRDLLTENDWSAYAPFFLKTIFYLNNYQLMGAFAI